MGKGSDGQSREINGDEEEWQAATSDDRWRDAGDESNADGVGGCGRRQEGVVVVEGEGRGGSDKGRGGATNGRRQQREEEEEDEGNSWGLVRLYSGCRAEQGRRQRRENVLATRLGNSTGGEGWQVWLAKATATGALSVARKRW
ncbi:hypothetical protein BHM03_00018808 [Ensete ventricosum]|nr:hypothetical protein BHM03_00018808 [Ensete ventricosum]